MIALPVYVFIGLQPNIDAEAANYPTLEIPTIQLETPVKSLELVERQLETPATIAGAYSQNPNKTLLIGHSSTVFRELPKVNLNDKIQYDDHTYTVTKIETLIKSEISMKKILATADEPTIVIMTCAGDPLPDQDATHRLLIYATIITP